MPRAYYLGSRRKKTLAETVRARDEYLPEFFRCLTRVRATGFG